MNPCCDNIPARRSLTAGVMPGGILSDADREAQIEAARLSMTHALTPDCQRFWWHRMRDLIAQRSPEQIQRMEAERRLSGPTRMKFHQYSEIFPLIEGAEFDALVADIKTFGLREKIWLYDDKILDGRNRFLACKKAGVEPEFRTYRGTESGALALVVSANVKRRHLNASQLAMAAARISSYRSGSNQHTEGVSIETASEIVGAKVASTKRARKVIEQGSKPLQRAVESGEVPVSRAAAVVDLPKPEQLKAAKQKQEPPPKPVELAPAPDFDFSGYEPEDDDEYKQRIENVMMADDKLAAMHEELLQAHREIQALKASRDHYQAQAGEAVRLVKARDRQIERLKRDLEKFGRAA